MRRGLGSIDIVQAGAGDFRYVAWGVAALILYGLYRAVKG